MDFTIIGLLASVIFRGLNLVIVKMSLEHVPQTVVMGIGTLFWIPILAPSTWNAFQERNFELSFYIFGLLVAGSATAYLMTAGAYKAMERFPAWIVQTANNASLIVAAVLGVLLLKENINLHQVIGGLVVLIGLGILAYGSR